MDGSRKCKFIRTGGCGPTRSQPGSPANLQRLGLVSFGESFPSSPGPGSGPSCWTSLHPDDLGGSRESVIVKPLEEFPKENSCTNRHSVCVCVCFLQACMHESASMCFPTDSQSSGAIMCCVWKPKGYSTCSGRARVLLRSHLPPRCRPGNACTPPFSTPKDNSDLVSCCSVLPKGGSGEILRRGGERGRMQFLAVVTTRRNKVSPSSPGDWRELLGEGLTND